MKLVLFFSFVVAIAIAAENYPTQFDNIDVDQILKSDRLMKNYINCLLDKGSCTPDGVTLRSKYTIFLLNSKI